MSVVEKCLIIFKQACVSSLWLKLLAGISTRKKNSACHAATFCSCSSQTANRCQQCFLSERCWYAIVLFAVMRAVGKGLHLQLAPRYTAESGQVCHQGCERHPFTVKMLHAHGAAPTHIIVFANATLLLAATATTPGDRSDYGTARVGEPHSRTLLRVHVRLSFFVSLSSGMQVSTTIE